VADIKPLGIFRVQTSGKACTRDSILALQHQQRSRGNFLRLAPRFHQLGVGSLGVTEQAGGPDEILVFAFSAHRWLGYHS